MITQIMPNVVVLKNVSSASRSVTIVVTSFGIKADVVASPKDVAI